MGFLDPSAAIVARLEAKLDGIGVGTAIDAGAILDVPQTEPAVYVIFDGYGPTQAQGQGAIQQIAQRWLILIKLRKVSGVAMATGVPAADEGAPVVDAVLGALCGWRPGADFDALRLGEGGAAEFSAGYAYFKLLFTTRTVVRGLP